MSVFPIYFLCVLISLHDYRCERIRIILARMKQRVVDQKVRLDGIPTT